MVGSLNIALYTFALLVFGPAFSFPKHIEGNHASNVPTVELTAVRRHSVENSRDRRFRNSLRMDCILSLRLHQTYRTPLQFKQFLQHNLLKKLKQLQHSLEPKQLKGQLLSKFSNWGFRLFSAPAVSLNEKV